MQRKILEKSIKVIIISGNGGSDVYQTHWYKWIQEELTKLGVKVILENMPDAVLAREKYWLPHIKEGFKADENTIIVGHSSGGVAALRYLEDNRLFGAIVIGVNYTDLDDEDEKKSGYYSKEWEWANIKKNANWIVQFSSQDDPYIPIDQPRFIHEQIDSEYHEYTDRGHFGSQYDSPKEFPELIEIVKRKIK